MFLFGLLDDSLAPRTQQGSERRLIGYFQLYTMSSRLRHRPQTEEEDAAALKLGPGQFLHIFICNAHITSSMLEFNNAGCLLISEVKYLLENRDKDAPDTACVTLTYLFISS